MSECGFPFTAASTTTTVVTTKPAIPTRVLRHAAEDEEEAEG
jgi:hypothetical protein